MLFILSSAFMTLLLYGETNYAGEEIAAMLKSKLLLYHVGGVVTIRA